MRSLNPFKDLPNRREVFAWGMYDFANQSFTLLIITMLFSLYVQQVVTPHPPAGAEAAAVEAADRAGAFNWGLMHGGSLLLVVAASPFIGAMADARGWRKQLLLGTGVACGILTALLAAVGPNMLLIAGLVYVGGNLCYQIGENLLASFLPRVSTPRTIGRVSALGWAMGYVGALGLLLCVLGGMLLFDWKQTAQWRPFFVFAGVWFGLGIIPAWLWLTDDEPDAAMHGRSIVRESVGRVLETVRHARQYRQLMIFLLAFFVYGFGVQTIIGFASIIARSFGFTSTDLAIFIAQITVTAGIAAVVTGRFQDRIGARLTVIIFLIVWMISCLGMIGIKLAWPQGGPQWPLWVVGNGLGFGLGGVGTASRSLVGRFTPRHRTAEFFGLWGMTYKLAGAIGVLAFGGVARVFGELASLVVLFLFFAVGFLLVLPVDETAGVRAARRAERAAARRPGQIAPVRVAAASE